ncbi:MAG: rhomboid family intramembrane serine protease [Woeseiaceae bacterium]
MDDDWAIVFESSHRQASNDRALVLSSLNIPHEILHDDLGYTLVVPAEVSEKAKYEIWQYEKENQQAQPQMPRPVPVFQNAVPGIVAYIVVIILVTWLAGESAFNRDWLAAGRVDGELIRQGEWWRTLTALTLHSGFRHLAGNIGFGALFGLLAGRLFGSGLTWLCVVIASGLANTLNTLLLASSHRSIGASTAVFATLGLVAGFVWRAKLMAQDRWSYRLGPIVGGIALLAYTGTGDVNTDIGAHLAGFVCGFGFGMLLTLLPRIPSARRFQLLCGTTAIGILAASWIIALRLWA